MQIRILPINYLAWRRGGYAHQVDFDFSVCIDGSSVAVELQWFPDDPDSLSWMLVPSTGLLPMNFSRRGALMRGVGFSILGNLSHRVDRERVALINRP